MNKSRNLFDALPEQDRKLVLDLCAKHSYEEAIEILARPRFEGGLSLVTSRSALCRFFTTSHPEPAREVLAQYASAAHVRHQYDSNAFLGAIRAAVEARVLENLRTGKALADLEKDFKLLKTAQSLYLEDSHWRSKNPKASSAAYYQFVQLCAAAPDHDFVLLDQLKPESPDQQLRYPAEFDLDLSDFERDLLRARLALKARADEHNCHIQAQQKPVQEPARPEKGCGEPPAEPSDPALEAQSTSQGSNDHSAGHQAPSELESERLPSAKHSVIPHIPPNSTSELSPTKELPASTCSSDPRPKPIVSPLPKLGRNEPCPCGSGLKYKKCCLSARQPAPPVTA